MTRYRETHRCVWQKGDSWRIVHWTRYYENTKREDSLELQRMHPEGRWIPQGSQEFEPYDPEAMDILFEALADLLKVREA